MFRHRGAILIEYFRSKEYKSVYYTARHDTLHAVHLDEIPSEHKDRDKCLYAYCLQSTKS